MYVNIIDSLVGSLHFYNNQTMSSADTLVFVKMIRWRRTGVSQSSRA